MLSVFNNSIQSGLWIARLKVSYGYLKVWYLKVSYEYTCTTLFFFYSDRHKNYINKETHKKCVDVKCNNSQSMRKKTKKWEEPSL